MHLVAGRADYTIVDESIRHACEGFEAVTARALDRVAQLTDARSDHEHVTIYIRQHAEQFRVIYQDAPESLRGEFRLSIDVAADLELMRRLYDALYRPGEPIELREAVRWLREHPDVYALNAHVRQKPAAAPTRQVLFVLAADSPLEAVMTLARRLAESRHAVITIVSPLDADRLAAFTARGYRVIQPSTPLAEPRPDLVLYDENSSTTNWLPCVGVRCLPLATRWEQIAELLPDLS